MQVAVGVVVVLEVDGAVQGLEPGRPGDVEGWSLCAWQMHHVWVCALTNGLPCSLAGCSLAGSCHGTHKCAHAYATQSAHLCSVACTAQKWKSACSGEAAAVVPVEAINEKAGTQA